MAVLESSTKGKYFLTFILFMIGLGFALSTCDQNITGNSTSYVAKVNGIEIPQSQFYKRLQQFGFDQLTAKQLKQLNLGKNIIDQLVTTELFKQWGADLGMTPTKDEISKQIKELPYFLNERKQFDLTLYKQLLSANRLTPQEFEEDVSSNLLIQRASVISSYVPISSDNAKTHFLLKNTGANISIVKLKPSTLKKQLTVSEKEVSSFLNDSKNFALLNNLYERNKHLYVSAAQFKVHEVSASFKTSEEKNKIIEKLKKFKNISQLEPFSKAASSFVKENESQHSQIDHGWLAEQNMSFSDEIKKQILNSKSGKIIGPEINEEQVVLYFISDVTPAKNISFESAKNELAINHLKDKNTEGLDKLISTWQEKIKNLLLKNSISELKNISKSNDWEWVENQLMNKSEKNLLGSVVTVEDLKSIQNAKVGDVLIIKSLADVLVVKVTKHITADDKSIADRWTKEESEFRQTLERQFAEEQSSSLSKNLLSKSKVWKNEAFF